MARVRFGLTKAQRNMRAWEEKHGHMWKCGNRKNPTRQQAARGHVGSCCGRAAVVIWCRVQGAGSAYILRCQAHARPFPAHSWSRKTPELEEDFQCVPVADFETFQKAKRVRAELRRLADPDAARAEQVEQLRAKYLGPAAKIR
jgi:hypothetical protein